MTHDPYAPRSIRSGPADKPPPFPRVVAAAAGNYPAQAAASAMRGEIETITVREPKRGPTDLESIAEWFRILSYDDMKTWAAAVLGDGKIETAGDLADRVNEWQKRTNGVSQ